MNAPFLVARLGETCRDALKQHFAALPPEDQRLRFCMMPGPGALEAYVDGLDFAADGVFAVRDDDLTLAGVVHVAMDESAAEAGISVLPSHRGRGMGGALFYRAVEHARNRFVRTLRMHCLAQNPAIMHIARQSGMDIVMDGSQADGELALPPATPASITNELLADRFASYDYSLKQEVAAWTRLARNVALQ
ncbi:MAG TPA: GNAT family N-acetyltransferase [Casimicrobiaceae bacterium]|nr:GNAT family N-acetyltransferase [Casimicrobiaceae bacterium]